MKKGFTLVELAIVLIIIGIILVSAIKSFEIIRNARAKRILSQVVVLVDAQNRFYERMNRYAGDSDNDGGIDYQTLNQTADNINDAAANSKDVDFPFNELKQLSIISTETNATHASIAEGGPAYYASYRVNNIPYNVVVIRNAPCITAFQMELSLDKNQPNAANSLATGRVRWVANAGVLANAGTWVAANVCANNNNNTNILYLFDRVQ